MKVLFLTDDRSTYAKGNYYLAYQQAFVRHAQVTLCHPLDRLPDPSSFDLVVLGHSAFENFVRLRGGRFVPAAIEARLWFRHAGLRALRRTKTPKILFSKNDYKQFELKNSFISYVRPQLVVTHTRAALERFVQPGRGRLLWLPFGVDLDQFVVPAHDAARPFAVGFRANAATEWNGGERERFFAALQRLEDKRPVSLTMSKNGEGFLVGRPYVEWMQSCSLLGNSVSALGTVGPRFLEAMACGTVPLAPRHAYEGLLVPDTHYIAVDPGPDDSFTGLEGAVAKFFEDTAYQQALRQHGLALAREHSVDQHIRRVCNELGL